MRDRILVVDDNQYAADALTRILKLVGYQTASAYSGQQALAESAAFQPDMALIDIGMPEMDGYEVAKRIRELRHLPRIMLVALTAWARIEDQQRAYECGFDLHIAKPISLETLRRVLSLLQCDRPEAAVSGGNS